MQDTTYHAPTRHLETCMTSYVAPLNTSMSMTVSELCNTRNLQYLLEDDIEMDLKESG
jgi:hypothetical protein